MGTVGAVLVTGLIFAVVPAGTDFAEPSVWWHVAGTVLTLPCAALMVWRRSRAGLVLLLTAVRAILFPVGPVAALGALTWYLARSSVTRAVAATALVAAAAAVTLVSDVLRPPDRAIFASVARDTGEPLVLHPLGYALVGVVAIVLTVTVGLVRRSQEGAAGALAVARERAAEAHHLRGELDRQEERELIAREMHDTVAHHLSIVSLHAAALEVTSEDPAVPESARAMRASAHRALEEMRALISSLRDSNEAGYTGAVARLDELPRLIHDAQQAGARITADLDVVDTEEAPVALTRAVYRIVQESLTNAIKHAPESPVTVRVVARPEEGVEIGVATWLPPQDEMPGAPRAVGGYRGAGLLGMRERASALGGRLDARSEEGMWVVRAWLPWHAER